MHHLFKLLVAVVALAVAWQVGRPRPVGPTPPEPPAIRRPLTTAPATGRFRGMAVQLHVYGDNNVYDTYHRLVPEVADLGADTILFVVHGWQEHAGSLDLHLDDRRSADAKDLGRLCDLATDHGLRIILMPIVLLKSPRNNEWRGKIVPENRDWDGWFARYSKFICHWAKIAEAHHVEVLMIGSELVKTESYTERWRKVITDVRQIYHGKLGYSANWDHYHTDKIAFWDALDYVGMTTYYKLADRENPTAAEVDKSWSKIKREIMKFQAEVNRPILFTEAGWCSQEGAALEAWNYYHSQKATEAGRREQALCYESFIRTWSSEPAVGGIVWWEWDLSAGGNDDYNYTPKGKPAEKILRKWYADDRTATTALTPVATTQPTLTGAAAGD